MHHTRLARSAAAFLEKLLAQLGARFAGPLSVLHSIPNPENPRFLNPEPYARPAAAFSEKLLAQLGVRFAGPISILRNWTFCLFYVMAELWGSVVVSLLFWGFANQARPVSCASVTCLLAGRRCATPQQRPCLACPLQGPRQQGVVHTMADCGGHASSLLFF
jgi:hypothetical protein